MEGRPDALRCGLRAIDLQPDYRDAYDLVANVLFRSWALEESAEFYARAVALAPNDALAHYYLGCCAQRALKDGGDFHNCPENGQSRYSQREDFSS